MKSYLTDLIGVVGAGLVSYGAWLIMPASGFATAGFFLIVGATISSRSAK